MNPPGLADLVKRNPVAHGRNRVFHHRTQRIHISAWTVTGTNFAAEGGLMNHQNDIAIFTVCNIAYLPKALVLAKSVKRLAGKKPNVVLFDRKQTFRHPADEINVIWVEDLGIEKLQELAFLYDIIEFSTSLKPFVARMLLQRHEKVIFLDPDTCLYSSPASILADLDQHPILLTPHYTTPQPRTAHESDLAMMRFGSFNLGFFAVRRGTDAAAFLNWWHDRCIDFCFMESQFGLSTDQKWGTVAPCLFESLKVSFNLGYNMAPWNTFERELSVAPDGSYVVNGRYPLVFFHFNNFDAADPQYLNKRASNETGGQYPTLRALTEHYAKRLKEEAALVDRVKYSFDYMSDGTYVSPTLRRAYAAVRSELPTGHDPFDSREPVGGFAHKNQLVQTQGTPYRYSVMRQVSQHGRTLKWVHLGLRGLLRVFGPNRFYDLTKLFVFLSMLRSQRDMWRL